MFIASASNVVKFHDFSDGQLMHEHKPVTSKEGVIKTISWGKDGNWLVLVPDKGLAEVISVRDNLKHLHTIDEISKPNCASFQNLTKKNMAVGIDEGQVLIYDIKSKNVKKRFPKTTSSVKKVEYTAKDTHIVAACENGEILLYSIALSNLVAYYRIPNSKSVSAVRCHPNRRYLLVGGSNEGVAAIWDINMNKTKFHIHGHAAQITDIVFSPIHTDTIVTLGLDKKFCFYDTLSKTCYYKYFSNYPMTAIDFFPDGIYLGVGSQCGQINIYDTRNMKEPMKSFQGHQSAINQMLFQKVSLEEAQLYTQHQEFFEKSRRFSNENNNYLFESTDELYDTETDSSSSTQFPKESKNYFASKTINIIKEPRLMTESKQVLFDIPEEQLNIITTNKEENLDNYNLELNNDIILNNDIELNNKIELNSTQLNNKTDFNKNVEESNENNSANITDLKHFNIGLKQFTDMDTTYKESKEFINKDLKEYNEELKKFVFKTCNDESIPEKNSQSQNPPKQVSPILTSVIQETSKELIKTIDLQCIRNLIKEEIRSEIEQMKFEFKFEFMEAMSKIHNHFMDLHMSMGREFAQLEGVLSGLKEEITMENLFLQ